MTVIRFPRGRQPRHIELARDLRDDLVAVADDGRDFAGVVLRLARLAQLQLAADRRRRSMPSSGSQPGTRGR